MTPFEHLLKDFKEFGDNNPNRVNPYYKTIVKQLRLTRFQLLAKMNGQDVRYTPLRHIKNFYGIEAKSATQCLERFQPIYDKFFN